MKIKDIKGILPKKENIPFDEYFSGWNNAIDIIGDKDIQINKMFLDTIIIDWQNTGNNLYELNNIILKNLDKILIIKDK